MTADTAHPILTAIVGLCAGITGMLALVAYACVAAWRIGRVPVDTSALDAARARTVAAIATTRELSRGWLEVAR